MPPDTAAWRKAGLTLDINLHPGTRGVSVYIWDHPATGTTLYVAHAHTCPGFRRRNWKRARTLCYRKR